ncbi:hypothetical protein CIW83_18475 [Tissierella sp. P1]|uniref:hypothetical protein n=1 Tax=Tissierella sp. P1 TaxID=1280483 RepID=UPI000BA0638A|nr:hypothetical protein [Tissierella sp. P1]OZV10804.1 hypothetical protein CIW83_18475 [Tissierella sp. P1]
MAYNTKSIIKDVNGKPVPQYWNTETQRYEVIESENGMLRVIMVDSQGNEIQSQSLVDQISNKLDELIQVVSK